MKLGASRFGTNTFPSDYDIVEQCTLNKADLNANNNKYYVIEAHQSKDGKKFRLYSRYGRVGRDGVEEERIPPQDQSSLLEAYATLKNAKTSSRKGYREVAVAMTSVGSSAARGKLISDDVKNIKVMDDGKKKKKKKSTLPDSTTADLVARIYNDAGAAIQKSLSASANASDQNPLGVLTTTQIQAGREILQDIQQLLQDDALVGTEDSELITLTNDFYSTIPQRIPMLPRAERMATMLLNTAERIDTKEDMLKLLEDAEVMKTGFETDDLSEKYTELGCEFTLVDGSEKKKIVDMVQNSQSSHHYHYGNISVVNVWKTTLKGQKKKHSSVMEKVGNVEMLFHGSRDCNIAGICRRGLLMRPPGVYVTGSMFGNGLYFADQSSKSAQYSSDWGGSDNSTNFLFVAAVSLGKIKKYANCQTGLSKPPSGYHSVQGKKGNSLLHNEFIIYDIKQNILEYLVEFKQ